MSDLQATIHEAVENAPPELLELTLAALIEARFIVFPKEATGCCEQPADLESES